MGYSVYEDRRAASDSGVKRWAGYGVPALCDYPGCSESINRGLGSRCDSWHEWKYLRDGVEVEYTEYWDDEVEIVHSEGCNMFFCAEHSDHPEHDKANSVPKADSDEWLSFMFTDESWSRWREEYPSELGKLKAAHERFVASEDE